MVRISTIATIFATAFLICPPRAAQAESEAEMAARGRYIATAIQGCGCHTREKREGGKEEDLRALYRYLRTIKPISNKVPANIPPK